LGRESGWSRRRFVKGLGTTVGAVGLSGSVDPTSAGQAPTIVQGLPEPPPNSAYPTLNRRTLGWLRLLWEKATTKDDWSSNGVPHPWWDRYTAPVVLSYGRFDLAYSTYALLVMADQTPAWREAYTRIADGLASRYPTYWGAIDWLTQIGDDPKRANYPPPVMNQIPQALRGKYNRFGWTANGVEPWGLQPDPIGADGYLFYRGWFTLVLAIYKYVSGDDKWARPFTVTGYHDETFEWDHHRMAERLASQYRAHPEGPHCENTKIWFFCNSATGLGMQLYDKVFGRQTHRAFENFLEYAKTNYIKVGADGKLQSLTSYYDPVEKFHYNPGGPAAGASTAFMILPQNREMGALLYDATANALGWRNPNTPVRANATGLLLARELGDDVAVARLSAAAEREYEPRFFGEHQEQFGWWFNLNEGFPRGQQSAMMMVAEVGRGGDWTAAFDAPHMDKFTAPTVEGIDFPSLGVSQAWNDVTAGTLHVSTYAASPDKRGAQTNWRVTNLPSTANITMRVDGQPFTRFQATGPNTIRLDTTIDNHRYEIVTGYRGAGKPNAAEQPRPNAFRPAGLALAQGMTDAGRGARDSVLPVAGPGCPCCPAE
jgi:hypothetical protein